MSIIADLFTSNQEIPGFGIVSVRDLAAARAAINPQDVTWEARGCATVYSGKIDHRAHRFTVDQVIEILEAIYGGTFGATATLSGEHGDTFRVTSWAE